MVLSAATATGSAGPSGALLLFMIVVTVSYLLACAVWPFKACRHCRGAGRHHGPMRGIRLCRHCDGSGLRLRFGRRVWNAGRRAYRDIKPRNHR